MDAKEREALEAAGYTVVSDVHSWLGLSKAESDFIHIKLDLRHLVRFARERAGLTQAQAARRLKSSQSRVSKMEGGDPAVSLDLLVSAALTLGATRQEVALAVAGTAAAPDASARPGVARPQAHEASPARRTRTRAA
jgi:transcriptional regulator with XRE-family HTH domain